MALVVYIPQDSNVLSPVIKDVFGEVFNGREIIFPKIKEKDSHALAGKEIIDQFLLLKERQVGIPILAGLRTKNPKGKEKMESYVVFQHGPNPKILSHILPVSKNNTPADIARSMLIINFLKARAFLAP